MLGPPPQGFFFSSRNTDRLLNYHPALLDSQLHPWICAFPETTFICVHWSLRYSREDILKYFEENYGGVPKNVVLWI